MPKLGSDAIDLSGAMEAFAGRKPSGMRICIRCAISPLPRTGGANGSRCPALWQGPRVARSRRMNPGGRPARSDRHRIRDSVECAPCRYAPWRTRPVPSAATVHAGSDQRRGPPPTTCNEAVPFGSRSLTVDGPGLSTRQVTDAIGRGPPATAGLTRRAWCRGRSGLRSQQSSASQRPTEAGREVAHPSWSASPRNPRGSCRP